MRRLLIRPGAIGDCILAFPSLEFLKADYTEIWVPTTVAPLIDFADKTCSIASSGLDMVGIGEIPMGEKLLNRLKGFDEIVSWYGTNRDEFRCAIESLGLRFRFHQALPPKESGTHATDFFCAQVGAPPGAVPKISSRMGGVPRGSAVFHPFSGSPEKNWPLSSFRNLAATLSLHVEWLAGPEEPLPEANRFENLRDLARWIAGASLYIGNDSGITHLAAASGVPTVALFGKTSPVLWAPRGENVTVVQHQPLSDLKPESVAALVKGRKSYGAP